jgi:hypothetical protein
VVALFAGSIDFYRGPGFHSAAEAAAGTAPTMMYWLNMPFFDAPFWARMPGSLFRLYTRGIFQPYQTLLPVVLAAILLLRSKQLALRAERRLVHGC